MINFYKKFKNQKFNKISQRDPSCGHLLLVLRSKLYLTFIKMKKKILSSCYVILVLSLEIYYCTCTCFFRRYIFAYFRPYCGFFCLIFFTIGRCEKYLSKSVIKIGKICSPPLPYAAAEKSRKLGLSYSKAYKSKTNKLFKGFFWYSYWGNIHVHHI